MEYEHYYSASNYYQITYGEKVYRLALDGGMTCPNRDGHAGFGGCSFCSEKGSGDFTPANYGYITIENTQPANKYALNANLINQQIECAKTLVASKAKRLYIAYFQSFTNTYAPAGYLHDIFSEALCHDDIVALSIATRPDCISDEIIKLLIKLKTEYSKEIYVELGLQTINDEVASSFNRGYNYSVFLTALKQLNDAGFPVIVHMILGLPTETPDDICKSVSTVSVLGIHGIKLSLLHILKETAIEKEYLTFPERFYLMDKQIYIETLCRCIELIPKDVVIYRITGDAPKKLLVAPQFTADKKKVLNEINSYMRNHNIVQGQNHATT